MTATVAAQSGQSDDADKIRVMIVDDSVVIRGVLSNWISESRDCMVVGSHVNGRRAADDVANSQPDVVILDLEMPEMDGLTALPLILERKPGTVVIVASTLSRRGAEVSLKALNLGAADYIPKPEAANGRATSAEFKEELLAKVRSLGGRAKLRARGGTLRKPAGLAPSPTPSPTAVRPVPVPTGKPKPLDKLRPYSMVPPKILVVGSSTGGPQALHKFFSALGPSIAKVPVLVVQHMPATFTAILAEHIGRAAGRPASEGVDGEKIEAGRIYVAPGGRHMIMEKKNDELVVRLLDTEPVNFCKPAVDPMFMSAASIFGPAIASVVLTGMGSDGAKGAKVIADAGGTVIAQDEETSVVWGMPGATFATGACSDLLPIDEIGPKIVRLMTGGRP